MTRWQKGGLLTISRGPKIKLHATHFYTFFLCLRLVTSKTYEVKIPIKPGVDCATD